MMMVGSFAARLDAADPDCGRRPDKHALPLNSEMLAMGRGPVYQSFTCLTGYSERFIILPAVSERVLTIT